MIDTSLTSFLYGLAKDLWSLIRRARRSLTPSEIVEARRRWKDEFETTIHRRRQEGLATDVIIRNVKRVDNYPSVEERRKGISPWFKVGLMGTYHRGLLAGLRWGSLKLDNDQWRYCDRAAGEDGDVTVILIGYIPYENIEAVDWDGDEYYYRPHIYCHFDRRHKQPYECLAFCERHVLNGIPYYTEVAKYDEVRRRSKKLGISDFT